MFERNISAARLVAQCLVLYNELSLFDTNIEAIDNFSP